ncbi:hypothetical protein, partial [uncultured Parasutterella sp.]|uniref:hypothetical protein n=1 Tax=uncultured Parasutterella sp. TaxID=1263098 RepID=UPI00263400E5
IAKPMVRTSIDLNQLAKAVPATSEGMCFLKKYIPRDRVLGFNDAPDEFLRNIDSFITKQIFAN